MLKAIFTGIVALSATAAFAQSELDNNKNFSNYVGDPSSSTVFLKVDKDGNLSTFKVDRTIKSDEEAQKAALSGTYTQVPKANVSDKELDRKSSGVPSWYFYYRPYNPYFPVYNWGYNPFNPCWGGYYGGVNYFAYNYWGWNTGWWGYNGFNGWYRPGGAIWPGY